MKLGRAADARCTPADVLVRAGVVRLERPDKLVRVGADAAALGADAGVRLRDLGDPHAEPPGDPRRARDDHLRASSTRRPTPSPTACASSGVARGRRDRDPLPRPPRLHRGRRSPHRSSARRCCCSTPPSPRRQIAEVCARESPRVLIYDEEFTELCAGRREGRIERRSPGRTRPQPAHPTLDALIASGSTAALRAAARPRPRRDPDLRHDRRAEGRLAPPAALARPGRGAVLAHAAARPRDDADRRAALSLLGLRPLHPRARALLDARAAAGASTREATLAAIERWRPSALVVVPVMLHADPRARARRRSRATTRARCA